MMAIYITARTAGIAAADTRWVTHRFRGRTIKSSQPHSATKFAIEKIWFGDTFQLLNKPQRGREPFLRGRSLARPPTTSARPIRRTRSRSSGPEPAPIDRGSLAIRGGRTARRSSPTASRRLALGEPHAIGGARKRTREAEGTEGRAIR